MEAIVTVAVPFIVEELLLIEDVVTEVVPFVVVDVSIENK